MKGATIWFTGLSGAGKTSIAREVSRRLLLRGRPAYLLDGDNLRQGLNADLGFTFEDRRESTRRTGEVAALFADAGTIALVAHISPFEAERKLVRARHVDALIPFHEIFVDTPLAVCEERDPKGLYKLARQGRLQKFTGIDSPYERPSAPELRVEPGDGSVEEIAEAVLRKLDL